MIVIEVVGGRCLFVTERVFLFIFLSCLRLLVADELVHVQVWSYQYLPHLSSPILEDNHLILRVALIKHWLYLLQLVIVLACKHLAQCMHPSRFSFITVTQWIPRLIVVSGLHTVLQWWSLVHTLFFHFLMESHHSFKILMQSVYFVYQDLLLLLKLLGYFVLIETALELVLAVGTLDRHWLCLDLLLRWWGLVLRWCTYELLFLLLLESSRFHCGEVIILCCGWYDCRGELVMGMVLVVGHEVWRSFGWLDVVIKCNHSK